MLPWIDEQAANLLKLQCSPAQIAGRLPVSHETLYQHVYSDKVRGGVLWKNLPSRSKRESAMPVGGTGGARSLIGAPLVIGLLISKLESKWATGNVS